jgi:hypothetical protein
MILRPLNGIDEPVNQNSSAATTNQLMPKNSLGLELYNSVENVAEVTRINTTEKSGRRTTGSPDY